MEIIQKTCQLIIEDEVNCSFDGLDVQTRRECSEKLKFFIQAARHTPMFKLGRWDGYIRYFHNNGNTYVNLLDQVLPIIKKNGYHVDIIDERKNNGPFEFGEITEDFIQNRAPNAVWPEGHPAEGEHIKLRDHQVVALQKFAENIHSLQEVSTGAGKCSDFNTLVNVEIEDKDTTIIKIGELINFICEKEDISLEYNEEQRINTSIKILTPNGMKNITHVIKKKSVGVKITFENTELICADNHQLFIEGMIVFAKDIQVGDIIDGNGTFEVLDITSMPEQDFYDITIPEPHCYFDADGILHHNTILSSCMSLMAEPYGKTLVIVPSRDLVTQTKKDYDLLGLDVGVYYGKTKETDKTHTIATWQSIESWKKDGICKTTGKSIIEFASDLSAIIVDEAQSAKGSTLTKLLADTFSSVPLRWGISGTIPKEDEIFNGLLATIGPIVNSVTARSLMDKDILSDCDITMIQTKDSGEFSDYQDEMKYLVSDPDRLDWYAGFIKEIAKSGNTLVLFNKIVTGEELHERIPDASLVHGVVKSEARQEAYDEINTSDNQIVLASYGVASTGINIPRIFNLVLIEPGKSFVRVIQSIGRSIRRAKDKDHANVYDISSSLKYSKKHMKARQKLYDDAQYPYELQKVDIFKQLESKDFRVFKKTKSED